MAEESPYKDDDSRLQRDSLKDVGVLNDKDAIWGIPSQIFIGGIVLSLVFSVMLRWWTGLAFGTIYITSMYEIHKDNPNALAGWVKAAARRRQDTWTSWRHKERVVYIIDNRSNKK